MPWSVLSMPAVPDLYLLKIDVFLASDKGFFRGRSCQEPVGWRHRLSVAAIRPQNPGQAGGCFPQHDLEKVPKPEKKMAVIPERAETAGSGQTQNAAGQ